MELKRCTACVTPETHETIIFDKVGVCNICRQQEVKKEKIDWVQRKQDLGKLIETYRGKYDYDCIVPFSGGKDSTFTLYYLMKEYGIKPLVVRFDHGFYRPILEENLKRTVRKLGVDVISYTPDWKVVRRLMLQSLLDKGDFCWHCHTGIASYPLWTALQHNVPLLFRGEPTSEYTAYFGYDQQEELDEHHFNRTVNLGISGEDMIVRLGGDISARDIKPFTFPPMKDLKRMKFRNVFLGTYIPWDVRSQCDLIKSELGWMGDTVEGVPPEYDYEKIECYMQGVRDYIKYIKRGYSRATHLTSIDIRNGRISREDAMKLVKEYEGKRPKSLDVFLGLMNLKEDEFMQIALSHEVAPYKYDPTNVESVETPHDFDKWSREGQMDRAYTSTKFEEWKARRE